MGTDCRFFFRKIIDESIDNFLPQQDLFLYIDLFMTYQLSKRNLLNYLAIFLAMKCSSLCHLKNVPWHFFFLDEIFLKKGQKNSEFFHEFQFPVFLITKKQRNVKIMSAFFSKREIWNGLKISNKRQEFPQTQNWLNKSFVMQHKLKNDGRNWGGNKIWKQNFRWTHHRFQNKFSNQVHLSKYQKFNRLEKSSASLYHFHLKQAKNQPFLKPAPKNMKYEKEN